MKSKLQAQSFIAGRLITLRKAFKAGTWGYNILVSDSDGKYHQEEIFLVSFKYSCRYYFHLIRYILYCQRQPYGSRVPKGVTTHSKFRSKLLKKDIRFSPRQLTMEL